MGLDQYAGTLETKIMEWNSKKEEYEEAGPFEWRKHARLQEFMTRLYMAKNGKKKKWRQDFFGKEPVTMPIQFDSMELDEVDIKLLEEAFDNGYKDFHCDGGFFWGHQFQEESVMDYKDTDRKFINYAKKALAKGSKVFYQCSW